MNNYIALLRGVNVGGKNKLPMSDLRAAVSAAGLQQVQSYIQSGNLVFQSTTENNQELQTLIAELLQSQFSINTTVMVRRTTELNAIIEENPFDSDPQLDKALQLYFLHSAATEANLEKLKMIKSTTERYSLSDGCFYLLAPDGVGRSKLAAAVEKLLGVTTTTRNWRTANKLLELAS